MPSNSGSVNLIEATSVLTPDGLNVGWVEFETKDQALTFFNISPKEKTAAEELAYYTKKKLAEIKAAFNLAPYQGYTCSLGFKVDSTRDDLKNYQDLLYYMNANSIPEISIRVNDGALRTTTLAEIETIISDLIGYGLYLYQYKWDLETAIAACTTVAEINAIAW